MSKKKNAGIFQLENGYVKYIMCLQMNYWELNCLQRKQNKQTPTGFSLWAFGLFQYDLVEQLQGVIEAVFL